MADVKDILGELQDIGFPISQVAEHTGIGKTRLYNSFNDRPARFDSKEVEKLETYLSKAKELLEWMAKD